MHYRMALLLFAACATTTLAQDNLFTNGPVFTDYGPVADVDVTMPMSTDTIIKHSFDVSTPAPAGGHNQTLASAARFINMHARLGFPTDNVQVAIVVHGRAVLEMADEQSGSAGIIAALTEHGVRIIVCGQSAANRGVTTEDLLPGVEMALSAMTAHALLQQQGYSLNPF